MNEIVRVDLQQLATEYGYTKSQLDLVRLVAAKDCTDEEVAQLLALAYVTGLNPLQKQLYMVRRFDSQANRWQATPQTGIDGFRSVADNTERYAPGKETVFQYDESGNLFSATAYVKKLVGGTWHEVPATALYREYVQLKKDGKPNTFWARMPHVMLDKCAEGKALRRAFPSKLSGIYTHDEMAQASVAEDEPTIIIEPATTSQVANTSNHTRPSQNTQNQATGQATQDDRASREQMITIGKLFRAAFPNEPSDNASIATSLSNALGIGLPLSQETAKQAIDYLTNQIQQEPTPSM